MLTRKIPSRANPRAASMAVSRRTSSTGPAAGAEGSPMVAIDLLFAQLVGGFQPIPELRKRVVGVISRFISGGVCEMNEQTCGEILLVSPAVLRLSLALWIFSGERRSPHVSLVAHLAAAGVRCSARRC